MVSSNCGGHKDRCWQCHGLCEGLAGRTATAGLRLEEIESASLDGKAVWLITLSNLREESLPASLFPAYGADAAREYKIFTVAKDSGEVLSMKIRLSGAERFAVR